MVVLDRRKWIALWFLPLIKGLIFQHTFPTEIFEAAHKIASEADEETEISQVRRVPPYFTYKLERVYRVGIGGSVNLTCVAVGYPMPRVFWKRQSDDFFLNDPQTAPIGKNVLTLTNLEQTENYTCIAVSKLGNIETSTTVEVKELLPAPTNLKILEVTATTVSLRWNPVTNIPDDDSLRGYIIKYRQKYAERGAYKEVKVPGDANSALIENLEPYQQYEFSAQVVSTIGRGTLSPPVEAQTSEAAPGAPPSNVQARSLNRNSILIRWDPPTDKQNGRINGYKIHYTNRPMSTDVTEWEVKEVKQDELMTTLYELDPDKTYYVQVQAKNAKGYGPMSKVVTVITKPGIPGQPSNLVAKALDSHRIQLNWQKPMHSYNINGYVIQYSASEDGVKELTLASDVQKHIVDGLRPNTIYTFKVAAQSDRGQGTFCDEVQTKTHESVPTLAPQIKDVLVLSSSVLHIFWDPIETSNDTSSDDDHDSNYGILTYKIEWRPFINITSSPLDDSSNLKSEEKDENENEFEWNSKIQDSNISTELKIIDLKPYQVYEIRIAAGNGIGFGPYSQVVKKMTKGDG
uniref:protein-tyrosine-phosphatase n=1 Tax=Acrobeloides nanus TaxID=290746 RepID=A0A914EIH3_9BILA